MTSIASVIFTLSLVGTASVYLFGPVLTGQPVMSFEYMVGVQLLNIGGLIADGLDDMEG